MEINTETAKLIQREKSLSYLTGICNGLEFANSCKDAISKASVFEILGNLMAIPYDLDRQINEKDVSKSMDEINDLPPVLPMYQQGKWIFAKTNLDKHGYTVECSSCHKKWKTYDEIRWGKENKYCPNCGSRNEVEDD